MEGSQQPKGASGSAAPGGGEPRPPQSMQHSSDDRRRAHPATGGSRGSAAPEGEPSPMLRKQRDVTDGGTLTASEGSCGSAAPEGRVPSVAEYAA